jgi:predicted acyl esterase
MNYPAMNYRQSRVARAVYLAFMPLAWSVLTMAACSSNLPPKAMDHEDAADDDDDDDDPEPGSGDSDAAGGATKPRDAGPAKVVDAAPSPKADAAVAPDAQGTDDAGDAALDESFADCFAASDQAPSGAGGTPYPGGRWTVPKATYGTVIESDVKIEMSDGAILVGDVSYPTDLATGKRAAGKFPVLLTQDPYSAAIFGAPYGEIFVTHGYIYASVDVRGTSRSGGGPHDLFSPREAKDGAELVTWTTTLEGSDGTAGLQGCSQLGINQLETATLLGPNSPVKAMIPACPSGDFYRDTAFDNGVPSLTGSLVADDVAMGADTAYYREYWRMRDRVARAPAIARADIPTLLWSGWHEPGALGSFDLYTVLQNVAMGRPDFAPVKPGQAVTGKYQVIVGDWGHGSGLDLGIELQWFDTWIKGLDTGIRKDTKTPLHLNELGGTKRWINARCYPLVQQYKPLYLSPGAKLLPAAEADADSAEVHWVPQDQATSPIEFTSEPFVKGAMLAGPFSAQLQVTSSNRNVQLFVELLDRAPDGTTLSKISYGSIIGSLRKTDPEKSWTDEAGLPVRPYLSLDEDQPMSAGMQTQLTVPLGTKVWSIEPGHSITVRISAHPLDDDCLGLLTPPVGCYPTTPMLDSLANGVYRIHLGGELGSLLSLPLLDHGTFQSVKALASPTGTPDYPLPIDW